MHRSFFIGVCSLSGAGRTFAEVLKLNKNEVVSGGGDLRLSAGVCTLSGAARTFSETTQFVKTRGRNRAHERWRKIPSETSMGLAALSLLWSLPSFGASKSCILAHTFLVQTPLLEEKTCMETTMLRIKRQAKGRDMNCTNTIL